MTSFEEIMDLSRKRAFAFLLNGIQANLLLLFLEIALENKMDGTFIADMDIYVEILKETKERLLKSVGKERFITLSDLYDWSKSVGSGRIIMAEDMKSLIEKIYNDRARSSQGKADGSETR